MGMNSEDLSSMWSWVEGAIYCDLNCVQRAALKRKIKNLDVLFVYYPDSRNFYSNPADRSQSGRNEIGLSEYGLLSLWFLSVAAAQIGYIAGQEVRMRTELCKTDSGEEARLPDGADESPIVLNGSTPESRSALRHLKLAETTLKRREYVYEEGDVDLNCDPQSPIVKTARLSFERAVGFILLHELGHLVSGHQADTTKDISYRQEHEADNWADDWYDKVKSSPLRSLRQLGIGIVICWLGILDISKGESPTHPNAGARFFHLYPIDKLNELDGGMEVLGYLLSALFFKNGSKENVYDTPRDLVQSQMEELYKKLKR